MKIQKIIINTLLGILSVLIYIYTTYIAYRFFHGFVHLRNIWLLFGIISIMLCGLAAIWFLLYGYDYLIGTRKSTKNVPEDNQSPVEEKENEKEEKFLVTKNRKEIVPTRKVREIQPPEESLQKKKDKKIQKRYQEILKEYKKTLSVADYNKFEESTRYDILLYDALMVSRDKEGTLLGKIEQEKGESYTNALKKILE